MLVRSLRPPAAVPSGAGRRRPGPTPAGRSGRRYRAAGPAPAQGCPGVPRRRRFGSPALRHRRWPRRRPGGRRGSGTRPPPRRAAGRERGGRSGLRGNRQPVGALVPAHGEEPLGVRRFQEPAQPRLEQPCRDGAVGQRQLLGYGSKPPHVGGSHQYSRRQVGALGLDVEAARSDNIVEANSREPARPAGWFTR